MTDEKTFAEIVEEARQRNLERRRLLMPEEIYQEVDSYKDCPDYDYLREGECKADD